MFQLGRDLRRLLGLAGPEDRRDPALLELAPPETLAAQAQAQADAAGRPSAHDPAAGWREASRLWREHARRTGRRRSLERALETAGRARAAARDARAGAAADLELALTRLVEDDLYGGAIARAACAEALARAAGRAGRGVLAGRVAAAHARLAARQAAGGGEVRAAAALLDAALHELEAAPARLDPWLKVDAAELRLERAGLGFASGLREGCPLLLDQAGRDLRGLVERCDADYAPLTRARALAACGAGLSLLGELAGRTDSLDHGLGLIRAAAELFTPDHSPLDAAAIRAAEGAALLRLERATGADGLAEGAMRALLDAGRAAQGGGLRMGVEIAALRNRLEVSAAVRAGDLIGLAALEARTKARLARRRPGEDPVGWALDQQLMAGIYRGYDRMGARGDRREAITLAESAAAEVLAEHGFAELGEPA